MLRGIDLALAEHEVVCLIGASGSGKSTLLRCVNLLEPIDAGRILVRGTRSRRAASDENDVRRGIGIVFQSYNLFPHMSVLRNVTLGPRKALGISTAEAEARADELLARFGLSDKRDDYPDRLSGGQQQRVAIVRALAMRPQLMLLDEVTSALDPELVAEVLDVIRELAAGGMTMLIATHEMSFARDVAHRVCFLDEGVILEEGTPDEIFGAPREPRTQQFLQRIVQGRPPVTRLAYRVTVIEEPQVDITLEPLDEFVVVQPVSDETETRVRARASRVRGGRRLVPHRDRHRRRQRRERHRGRRQGALPARRRLRGPPRRASR